MASFKSDAQGFLVGELVTGTRDILRSQQQGMGVWKAIRADVKSIARAMNVQVATVARVSQSSARAPSGPRGVATPIGRTSSGTSRSSQSAASSRSGGSPSRSTAVAVPVQRSANGRFVAGQKRGGEPSGAPGAGGAVGAGSFKSLSESIGKLSGALSATDNVDPTINAMKEVTDVVGPLGRGLFSLFGRNAERKKERWYQRFWKALTSPIGARAGATTGGGGGGGMLDGIGGMLGGMGGMLKNIPALLMTVFSRILMPIAALWGAFELGQWVGKKIYEWLDSSGLMAKAFDAFDAIGASFSSAWASVTGGIDSVVSSISTAWTATTDAFTGAIKSFMTFPDKIGEVLSGIDSALRKLPIIGEVYGKAADTIKTTAAEVKTGFTEGQSGSTGAAPTSAAQAIGRDGGKVFGAVKAVGTQAGAGYDVARGGTTEAAAPTSVVQKVARAVGGGVGTVATAGANAGLMLKAGRDAGMSNKELANFMGQNAHESAGFTQTSENLNYSAKGLRSTFGKYYKTDAEAQADAKNPEAIANKVYGGRMGNTEEGDGYKFRGRGFTQLTGKDNYASAGKALGLDLVGNPDQAAAPENAAKISAWYWKNRVSKKGAGEDVTAATKLVNGGTIGLDDRKKQAAEWEAKIAAGAGGAAVTTAGALPPVNGNGKQVAMASIPTVQAANVPSSVPVTIPPMPDTPAPATPLNSAAGAGRGAVQVNIPEKTGQNIGDRSIAHIVTGGMGSA